MERLLVLLLAAAGAGAMAVAPPALHARPAPVAVVSCVDTQGLSVHGIDPGSYQVCIGPGDPT